MTACCQIICTIPWLPCEQLPYLPEHPRISRIRQRDKSELPLLTLSYKYFLPWYSFSTLSSCILQTHLSGGGIAEELKISSKNPPHRFFKSPIFFFSRKKWPSTWSSPRLIYSHLSSLCRTFTLLQVYLLSIFFLSFSLFFQSSNLLGIERKNCHPHRATSSSMPRSIGWPRSPLFDQCRNQ